MSWKNVTGAPGVLVKDLATYEDDRGSLTEFWRGDDDRLRGLMWPSMGYVSMTLPGQVRGPHEHKEQTDFFVFPGPGAFVLYLWKHGATEPVMLYVGEPEEHGYKTCAVIVPPGIIHGYKCFSPAPGLVINIPNKLYRGPGGKGEVDEIRHEDDPESPYKIPED